MELPHISINGSDPENLLEDVKRAHQALAVASAALAHTAPNPRDYDREKWNIANREFKDRAERLLNIRKELETLADFLQYEIDRRTNN